jgi:hypothetical protein
MLWVDSARAQAKVPIVQSAGVRIEVLGQANSTLQELLRLVNSTCTKAQGDQGWRNYGTIRQGMLDLRKEVRHAKQSGSYGCVHAHRFKDVLL